MIEEKGMVKYQARDGQEITLSFQNVKKYLVQGNSQVVTEQELMYFLAICKSRGLNPFKKDAYLIKYGNDPAAVVTSIDYFRSRARAQKDCVGWKKGIIVKTKDGSIRKSHGLILDDEELLGGFFEATPSGWKEPMQLEVNLRGYIKRTKEGGVTRFWAPENQPTMIAKVAESQGLRMLWPDEFQGIYEQDEIPGPIIDMKAGTEADTEFFDYRGAHNEDFAQYVKETNLNETSVNEFVALSARALDKSADEIKALACKDFESFREQFRKWSAKHEELPSPKDDPPPQQPELHSCPYCEFTSESERGLKQHITKTHSDIESGDRKVQQQAAEAEARAKAEGLERDQEEYERLIKKIGEVPVTVLTEAQRKCGINNPITVEHCRKLLQAVEEEATF